MQMVLQAQPLLLVVNQKKLLMN